LSKLNISSAIADRLSAFMTSDAFTIHSSVAKTEYWRYFSDQLRTDVSGSSVKVVGHSGFYVPPPASVFTRLIQKIARAARQPSLVGSWVGREVARRFAIPRLMSAEKAFDAVMSNADVSVPVMSAFAVDHRRLAQHPNVFANVANVVRHYEGWSGNKASANIISHYYYQNILRGSVEAGQVRTLLEIGAGNGNFPSILYHDWAPVRIVLIDLPETLAISIPYLSSLFPSARIAMPNEIQADGFPREFDFAFLTVDQLGVLESDSIDLAINCHSFQEMTHEQIDIYFKLIQRVCRNSGLFFTANRVEKIPSGAEAFSVEQPDPPNRMAEYPWNSRNSVLVYEICRLSRLVQLDSLAIRLERINKSLR
jgi:putative sugar O-methyltransferase